MYRMCGGLVWMLMNSNEWLVERLHVASLTSQWSGSLASRPHRLACWVLDGLQISLIGLRGLTLFFPQPWSASSLVVQNVSSLRLAPLQSGMSGDGAVNTTRAQCNSGTEPTLQQSHTHAHTHTHTYTHTHTHARSGSLTPCLCYTEHRRSQSHIWNHVCRLNSIDILHRNPTSMNTNMLKHSWHFAHVSHWKRPCPFFHPAERREAHTESEGFLMCQADSPCGAVVLSCLIETGEAEGGDGRIGGREII